MWNVDGKAMKFDLQNVKIWKTIMNFGSNKVKILFRKIETWFEKREDIEETIVEFEIQTANIKRTVRKKEELTNKTQHPPGFF